ncbi:Uncharacterized protein ChrSV_3057 [Chromobacterium vaccinii]|nr:Uncharacterized protein ChrSW_3057 [Chromobacterium vaccinii]QND90514.1 Uncharacterized protein ChrSV_3057 [Chromobacterium vaccinii]
MGGGGVFHAEAQSANKRFRRFRRTSWQRLPLKCNQHYAFEKLNVM